jgi:hypothetical protein
MTMRDPYPNAVRAINENAACGQQQAHRCETSAPRSSISGDIGGVNVGQAIGLETNGCDAKRGPTIRAVVEVDAYSHFERALGLCKDGARITRAGWNGPGQFVFVQYPDKHSRMTQPYMVLRNALGEHVPWVPSQGDIFATDWAVLPYSAV